MKSVRNSVQKKCLRGFLAASALTVVLSPLAQAEEQKFRLNLEDVFNNSSITTRYRHQEKADGFTLFNQMQYSMDLKLQLSLTKDGRLKIKGRVINGPSYGTEWSNVGVGNDSTGKFDPNIRQFYFEYTINDKMSAQLGALPVLPDSMGAANTAFVTDGGGWIDGARINYSTLRSWAKEMSITVGSIDEFKTPAFYDRNVDTPNFIQIHVKGVISPRFNYVLEATSFKAENGDQDEILRGIVNVAVGDIVGFIDTITLEELVQTGADKAHQGFAVSMKKAIRDWTVIVGYSQKEKELSMNDTNHIPRDDFYGPGRQASFVVQRKLPHNLMAFARVGKSLDHTQFLSLKGARVEVGLKYTFKARKK